MDQPEPLRSGDQVRVLTGAFEHFIGVVRALGPQSGQVQVELSMFNRKSTIALKDSQVVKVK
jgi:transcription antitermination factor NusG